MAEKVLMPKAGITVEECIITEWIKKKGDTVKIGDILFSYETDKATFECESTAEGEILEIFYQDGSEVPVMVPVCAVGKHGEDVSGIAGVGESKPTEISKAEEPKEITKAQTIVAAKHTGPVAENVLMPKAGITVEECIITEWIKKKGDKVAVGDVLFTYETDKASFECEATVDGEILEVFYFDGDEVPVMEPVCAIGNPGDEVIGGSAVTSSSRATVQADVITEKPVTQSAAPTASTTANSDVKVSPRAKMVAQSFGVDPTLATPTGPYGRVVEKDVRVYVQSRPGTGLGGKVIGEETVTVEAPQKEIVNKAVIETAPVAPISEANEAEYMDEKLSGVRKAISKSMMKSLSTMAQLTLQNSFDATKLNALRNTLKANGEKFGLPNITLNDMVLYAVTRVLTNYPNLNANLIDDTTLRTFTNVNLGMAVDTPRGLMVPTIFNANKKSLAELSKEAKELAVKCQQGSISPDLLTGASFTVSNLGAFGIESFTPVINPPQTGILGVNGITTRIKEVNGEIKTYKAMNLCLTIDHRAVDGAPGAKFLKELADALENFDLLLTK